MLYSSPLTIYNLSQPQDKDLRMAAIGQWIANDTKHDVFLLNDLWMRSDHEEVRKHIPKGRVRLEFESLYFDWP